ncbi:flavin reductase [Erysipelotrichaceae bacterium OttesenSCG-928-M19]|nr:flavin reductase [Erysipelotrichaceae bacterium OttesenSCG-928-M19]
MSFKEIKPEAILENPFKLIGTDWTLISAQSNGKTNTMTASWGFLGIMWHLPVVEIFIRPQRYTKEFVDHEDYFSLTFFNDDYRNTLNYLGTVSGRDENKIDKSDLTLAYENDVPYFKEAKLVLICKKLYVDKLKEENFLDKSLVIENYGDKDFHSCYFAKIEKVLIKE